MTAHLLVINEDPVALRSLEACFRGCGYVVTGAGSGQDGLRLALDVRPDAVVLDLRLQSMDGAELCRRLREWARLPILSLTPLPSPAGVIAGLAAGADVCLSIPVDEAELLARLRALLRRASMPRQRECIETITIGDLTVDLAGRAVLKAGRTLELSPMEFRLLTLLARHSGKVLPHRRLLAEVWGPEYVDDTQYLRIYIRYLREKLEDDPDDPRYILTEWGVGYRLSDPAEEPETIAAAEARR